MERVRVIGAGLAGCEAALKAAELGAEVELWEMKPACYTPAHHSPLLAELVCSNSLRADGLGSAVGLLKAEMELLGSAVMSAARAEAVAAGKALAVDRQRFAARVTAMVRDHPAITLSNRLAEELPPDDAPAVLATGPLTHGPVAERLLAAAGGGLHFYDAIAPIVLAESVDPARSFWQDRYGEPGAGDYLNCPLSREEFDTFHQALTTAEQTPLHDFEKPRFFEGCLPVEVMAARGEKTLTFGPMKPVGLTDSATGRRPFAALQLRKEDLQGKTLNMVGFQTKLTRPAQDRVFRLIPALAAAEFVRWGSIHRNTFLDAPRVLGPGGRLLARPHILVAGQLSGVEGYVESAASGILAGINAVRLARGREPAEPPAETALGGLMGHLHNTETKDFQPSNVNFGLLPPLGRKLPKAERGPAHARRALPALAAWLAGLGLAPAAPLPEP
jgi:methylenetetrahydrofolate--tRNA-(uracil-5-)-methyltransferase